MSEVNSDKALRQSTQLFRIPLHSNIGSGNKQPSLTTKQQSSGEFFFSKPTRTWITNNLTLQFSPPIEARGSCLPEMASVSPCIPSVVSPVLVPPVPRVWVVVMSTSTWPCHCLMHTSQYMHIQEEMFTDSEWLCKLFVSLRFNTLIIS